MTRNEAMSKLPNERWYGPEAQKGYLLDCLEALGLIKFDEEKQIKSPSLIIHDLCLGMKFTDCDRIVNAIMNGGYKIVQK